MNTGSQPWVPDRLTTLKAVSGAFAGLCRARFWANISSQVSTSFDMPTNLIGINVASQEARACDDYVIEHVRFLGLRCVRMGLSYAGLGQHPERLLKRLIDEDFEVMLNLFPPRSDAGKMATDAAARDQWLAFVEQVITHYGDKIAMIEIGNTLNRKKWAGWNAKAYLTAWSIAYDVVKSKQIALAGPNISDFEPVYNLAYLDAMSCMGKIPDGHTDNLFVERVRQPEAYDHRILGRWLGKRLKFNLVKKARTLADIGQQAGSAQNIVSYNTWTLKRLARWSAYPEQKQADYLVRYLMLAAASGALDKIYWGPLIDHRDGIIDDAAAVDYPDVDNVSHYASVRGEIQNFRPRPAFDALRAIKPMLAGSTCKQAMSADNGVNHFIFTSEQQEIHVCWCRDQYALPVSALYSELGDDVEFCTVRGEPLAYRPSSFTEQPVYIKCPIESSIARPTIQALGALQKLSKRNIIVCLDRDWQHVPYENDLWRGALSFKNNIDLDSAVEESPKINTMSIK